MATKTQAAKQAEKLQALMERIMSSPVPDQGQLKHPTRKDKKPRPEQASINDIQDANWGLPSDSALWSVKMFTDYFAKRYMDDTGANYKRSYKSDNQTFSEVGKFMASQGLERKEWTKRFIDWCIERRESIQRQQRYFNPQTICHSLNDFVQDVVLPQVETQEVVRSFNDTLLLEELKKVDEEGKAPSVFQMYGLPLAATYFVKVRGFTEEQIISGAEKYVKKLRESGQTGRDQLATLLQKSIINSAYPEGFFLLDWRIRMESMVKIYWGERWWRDEDYKVKPNPQYDAILGGGV